MRRSELEHIIRAAAAITDQYEIMIVGSQSILGAVPNPPAELVESMEADVYPLRRPELADLIRLVPRAACSCGSQACCWQGKRLDFCR